MKSHTFRQFYIPEHMMEGIKNYTDHGLEPGSFLTAIICNDLKGAVGKADDINIVNIPAYVDYFYNHTPSSCWGSEENMRNYMIKIRAER